MAKEYGLSYTAAMIDSRVKGSYTKAPRKRRTSGYIVPLDLDDEDTKANRAAAMARVKAMKAKRLANPPAPRVKKPMSEETKAMLKERRIRKTETRPSSPVDSTPAERKARRAMAASRAMELTQNKPVDYVPKARKPMSEETKAMLKERRAMKKADRVYDVSEKFDAFWNRHEGVPAGGPLTGMGIRSLTLGQIANDAAQAAVSGVLRSIQPAVTASISDLVGGSAKKARTKKNGQPYKKRESADNKDLRERREKRALDPALIKPAGVASKMHKPRKPTTHKSKLTPLSADDMALAFNLLN
jgi:hypothetical protein